LLTDKTLESRPATICDCVCGSLIVGIAHAIVNPAPRCLQKIPDTLVPVKEACHNPWLSADQSDSLLNSTDEAVKKR
jgi:hypothetical protein